jgi:NOL1/NOP2/fmu family ribosome biogenesis protein
MRRLCRDIYGIMLTDAQRDRDYLFVQLDKDVYIVHPSIVSLMDMDIYIRTTGIQCMTQISHGYKLDHGFASVLGYLATSCIYMIDESEAQRYTQGESLTVSDMSFVSSLSKETTNMVILRV